MFGKTVAVGLGSNLGDSLENLRQALAKIKTVRETRVLSVSSIFESDAQVPEKAPADWNKSFLNSVVLVETKLEPQVLLSELKKLEEAIGRRESEAWAPRIIDLDILYWSGEHFQSPALSIPHKSLLERPFALLPLLQVWPELRAALRGKLPAWAQDWHGEKPFNTKISEKVWPRIVGILNVTPDSFSGDGILTDEASLTKHLQSFVASGADIVDVGAESTRPQAASVPAEEELKRLNWALDIIIKLKLPLKVSLDSRRPEVVEKILERYKIDFLNDVTGFENRHMRELLSGSQAKAFVMHSLSIPPTKEKVLAEQEEPCLQLTSWWRKRSQELQESGISPDRLIFDPGIGFGKTPSQNLYVLKNLQLFSDITNEVMIGHSRKSYLNMISKRAASDRDMETALVTAKLNCAFTQYLRVHDPATQRLALTSGGFLC